MITIDDDLKDIVISALRYVMGCKTYITFATCDYIQSHPELIDERVKQVMLKDLEKIIDYYEITDPDFGIFAMFTEWLKNLEVE